MVNINRNNYQFKKERPILPLLILFIFGLISCYFNSSLGLVIMFFALINAIYDVNGWK